MDRRAMFFLGASVLCALLIWPCPAEFRGLGIALVISYFVMGILFQLEAFSRHRRKT